VQYPIYLDYWKKQPDVKKREVIAPEQVFCVPYKLPSGRVVKLRGKFDSLDQIGNEGIFLQENKSKGDLDEQALKRQLLFDLQTMFYFIALQECVKDYAANGSDGWNNLPEHGWTMPKGVRYNVIRRPLAGGKHSIRQHKPSKSNSHGESSSAFYQRLGGLIKMEVDEAIKTKQDCWFFMRWKVIITQADVDKFKQTCLDPVLEQLCDWYQYVIDGNQADSGIHYRLPYGIYNPLLEGRATDVDEYLATGSIAGLQRVTSLFQELG
jgi:hypothetical protein